MPELPEVEITRRGIEPHLIGQVIATVIVRNPRLRWPIPRELSHRLPGKTINRVTRRGKYLLLGLDAGAVILHLGMSGSLRVVRADAQPRKYDHFDLVLANGYCLRLRDPRRFGAVLWTDDTDGHHRLLAKIGPEPLSEGFDAEYLFRLSHGRVRAIRDLLLDSRIVAGIGNIYANEALFAAGIRPTRAAGRITRRECAALVDAVRATLQRAIRAGGTTLRDFRGGDGKPGYFQLALRVYGREGRPCRTCGTLVRARRRGDRRAFYCPNCQS